MRFGEFELDLSTRELSTNGAKQTLAPQPFQVLELLIQHRGQLVTRDDLIHHLWPSDTFVDYEQGLKKAINRLRDALNDSAEQPRFIETLPRQGYRFIAVLEVDASYRAPIPIVEPGVLAPRLVTQDSQLPPVESVPAKPRWQTKAKVTAVALTLVLAAAAGGGLWWYAHRLLSHPLARFDNRQWYKAGSQPTSYEAGMDLTTIYDGQPTACLRSKEDVAGDDYFGTLTHQFLADRYRGKRIRFSAFAKSENIQNWAGLWLRIDRSYGASIIDNMMNRPITGTSGWRQYVLVLDVPSDATQIVYGVLLFGSGSIWISSSKFDVVSSDVPTTLPDAPEPNSDK